MEKLLVADNNTTILKFFLYISPKEQLARFEERLDDPARQWKISASDYSERDLWDDYIKAFEFGSVAMLHEICALVRDPVESQMVPQPGRFADHRRRARKLRIETPKPTVDLQEIRRLYHQEVTQEKDGAKGEKKSNSRKGKVEEKAAKPA